MKRWIQGVLSNESLFGKIMTRFGILVGANIMFLIFSFPVVTIGPALVALYHVMLKVLRGDGILNPFKEFWKGFRSNFKQAMLYWVIILAVAAVAILDIRFCEKTGGIFVYFKYGIYAIIGIAAIITSYLMPVMAAFADTIPHLIRNAVFFASKNPVKMLIVLALNIVPLAITYIDTHMQPLYAFLWTVVGFAAVAMAVSTLLLKDFAKYLPKVNEFGEFIEED